MKKVFARAAVFALPLLGAVPAFAAECAPGDLIEPAVPVARGFDPAEIFYGSVPVRHTFKRGDTACIDQAATVKTGKQGTLFVHYLSRLGEHSAIVVESEWRSVLPAAAQQAPRGRDAVDAPPIYVHAMPCEKLLHAAPLARYDLLNTSCSIIEEVFAECKLHPSFNTTQAQHAYERDFLDGAAPKTNQCGA